MANGKLKAYSGLTTKIRAMKSKLISPSQYDELTRLSSVADLINYLQGLPSYQNVLSNMDPYNAHRGAVESRMTFSTYKDFSKIYHFAGNSQKRYLEYYFMQYEIILLKACMRNIMDSRADVEPILIDDHFKTHSKLDIDKLSKEVTMSDFLNELSGTVYERPIGKISELENPTLFDYEMSLDLFFFNYIWNHQDVFAPKDEKKYFINTFGAQIDLLNILWIYRCKNYYNLSEAQIYSFLIHVCHNLSNSEIKAFVETEDNNSFYVLINKCYYGRVYGFDPDQPIEAQFGNIIHNIYMKTFKEEPYSLAAINLYFHLKNMEVQKVVTIMECIRYGYSPETISQYIGQNGGVFR